MCVFFTTLYLILFKVPSGVDVFPLHCIQAFLGPKDAFWLSIGSLFQSLFMPFISLFLTANLAHAAAYNLCIAQLQTTICDKFNPLWIEPCTDLVPDSQADTTYPGRDTLQKESSFPVQIRLFVNSMRHSCTHYARYMQCQSCSIWVSIYAILWTHIHLTNSLHTLHSH